MSQSGQEGRALYIKANYRVDFIRVMKERSLSERRKCIKSIDSPAPLF